MGIMICKHDECYMCKWRYEQGEHCENCCRNYDDNFEEEGGASNVHELCKHCDDAFCRFMGFNKPEGCYERLFSEVAEQ